MINNRHDIRETLAGARAGRQDVVLSLASLSKSIDLMFVQPKGLVDALADIFKHERLWSILCGAALR